MRLQNLLKFLLLPVFAIALPVEASNKPFSFFQCGGELENKIWQEWNGAGKEYLINELITNRLVGLGDTYSLYDFEISFHNLLALAQRCKRIDRQLEFAKIVKMTYAQLEQTPGKDLGHAWVCRGGAICNKKNRLIDTEVMLSSVQFLAFATSVANGLARNASSTEGSSFVDETTHIALQHMRRWSGAKARLALKNRITASPSDVKDGSSALFFTDKDIWQISIYADLAGLLARRPGLRSEVVIDFEQFKAMREHVAQLLKLFRARTTLMTVKDADGKPLVVADLDRGFWRLYVDNRYAGYSGMPPPVSCVAAPNDPRKKEILVRIDASLLRPVDSLGWDISHARRLVHFFDAIERNRSEMQMVYGLLDKDLPSQQVMASFAHQLRVNVWNQDVNYPLFTNYYSGINGWYRVAYDNGTDQCTQGVSPYGLTGSFATAAYATWEVWDKPLGALGRQLYELTESSIDADKKFVKAYYGQFSDSASPKIRLISKLSFWPALIHD